MSFQKHRARRLGISAKRVAVLLLPIALAACASGDDSRSSACSATSKDTPQSFPSNYRTELLAFMKTYLNNPVGVRDAALGEPVMRDVNGKMRYISLPALFGARVRRQLPRAARARGAFPQRPARPHDREERRTLRGRGDVAISRNGKNDAVSGADRGISPNAGSATAEAEPLHHISASAAPKREPSAAPSRPTRKIAAKKPFGRGTKRCVWRCC